MVGVVFTIAVSVQDIRYLKQLGKFLEHLVGIDIIIINFWKLSYSYYVYFIALTHSPVIY